MLLQVYVHGKDNKYDLSDNMDQGDNFQKVYHPSVVWMIFHMGFQSPFLKLFGKSSVQKSINQIIFRSV